MKPPLGGLKSRSYKFCHMCNWGQHRSRKRQQSAGASPLSPRNPVFFTVFRPAAAAAAAGFRKHKKLKKHDCERNKASIVNLNAVVKMKQNNLNID